jgi:hypothetical protein
MFPANAAGRTAAGSGGVQAVDRESVTPGTAIQASPSNRADLFGAGVVHYRALGVRDGDVDRDDADRFESCLTISGAGMVTAGCVTFDFNSDQSVDCTDWASFLLAYTEPGLPPISEACTIPTVSHWGLVVLSLALLVAGTLLSSRGPQTSSIRSS